MTVVVIDTRDVLNVSILREVHDMTKDEYDSLQLHMYDLLHKKTEYTGNKKEAYRNGVLAAKSLLHSLYKFPDADINKWIPINRKPPYNRDVLFYTDTGEQFVGQRIEDALGNDVYISKSPCYRYIPTHWRYLSEGPMV